MVSHVGHRRAAQPTRTALPGTPYGIAYDPVRDRLWVTLTARNEVVGVALGAAKPSVVATFPTVRQPNTVAVDPVTGRVFVASRTDGTVEFVESKGAQVLQFDYSGGNDSTDAEGKFKFETTAPLVVLRKIGHWITAGFK